MRTVFPDPITPHPGTVKGIAYGGKRPTPPVSLQSYRLERGFPFQRYGKVVFATPQWRTQTIYSQSTKTAQLPTVTQTPVSVAYPYRTK